VDIEAGTGTGDLSFGAGANALTINGGASVTGALSAPGGTLALNVAPGSLQINSANRINPTGPDVSANGKLVFTAEPAAGQATQLVVAGTANIAQGAQLGLRVTSVLNGSQTFTLVSANQLNMGAANFSATAPFIYNASLTSDATSLTLTLARKTA